MRERYEGTDQWLKAPNGEKSNLSEKQWLQVRTPNFKRWFGDWETIAEIKAMNERLASWTSKYKFNRAKGKTREEIFREFGNKLEPIAYIPEGYLQFFDSSMTDNRVYCGLGYFLDHAVNHHPEVDPKKYLKIQEFIDNADDVKLDAGNTSRNNSILFIKNIGEQGIVIVSFNEDENGKIVLHKSFFDKFNARRFNKLPSIKLPPEVGHPSISPKDNSSAAGHLSALDDDVRISKPIRAVKPENVSKVVDENGEPLVVYHGTDYGGFSVFNTSDVAGRNTGAFFSDEDRASWYAIASYRPEILRKGDENTSGMYACYLDIKNPKIIDAEGEWAGNIDQTRDSEEQDGVIVHNVVDGTHDEGSQFEATNYIVFEPTQIKSATDNRGTFDGNDPEIYNQILGEKGAEELDKKEKVTYRMDNLKVAKDMTEAGKDAKTIRIATGWEQGKDGKWRWEIMDGVFDFMKAYNLIQANEDRGVPISIVPVKTQLRKIFKNRELYKAYPNLAKITVYFAEKLNDEDSYLGAYHHSANKIVLKVAERTPDEIQSTLIHEIQHAIQYREGFANGGNKEQFEKNRISTVQLRQDLKWYQDRLKHAQSESEKDTFQREIKRIEDRIDEIKRKGLEGKVEVDGNIYQSPFAAYWHLGGEAESRNVQRRENFTAEKRRATLLSETLTDTDKPLIERYNQAVLEDKDLQDETEKWSKAVDDVFSGKINPREHIKIMNTPKVFNLIGANELPIYMDASKVVKTTVDHKGLTSGIIKQIPYAISDPVAIFTSATRPKDSIVVMTEITDADKATVIVPVHLDFTQDGYQINKISSVYAKKNDQTGNPNNQWFIDQIMAGRLRYINNKKFSDWSNQTGLHLPVGSSNQNLYSNIPNEKDFDKLLQGGETVNADNGSETFNQQAGENPKKSFLSWLSGVGRKIREFLTYSAEPQQKKIIEEKPTFSSPETERRYVESKKGVQPVTVRQRVKHATLKLLRSMSGNFPELAGDDALIFAREAFRKLGREKSAQVRKAMKTFEDNLSGLSERQLDLFGRKRLLDDLKWRKEQRPDAKLPFGLDDESLKAEHEKFSKLVENDSKVKKAIEAEEETIRGISKKFVDIAGVLGLKLDDSFKNPHYYRHVVLEYANAAAVGNRKDSNTINNIGTVQDLVDEKLNGIKNRSWLKHYKGSELDISSNYVQAMGEVRVQMLMDIATMGTLIKIKKKHDIAPKLKGKIKEYFAQNQNTHNQGEGMKLSDIIPEGYEIYNPAGSRLVQSANSPVENVIAMALDDASEEAGVEIDEVLTAMGLNDEETFNQLWVIPKQIKESLKKMAKRRDRGAFYNTVKTITTWWKKAVLFSPTRNLKYNLRNFTGDLDALIAGNPYALKFVPQAISELTAHYIKNKTTQDLQEYLDRSGGMNIESMNFSDKEAAELEQLAKDTSKNASIPKKGWNLIKKFFAKEVSMTQYREHLLRYAAYLAYKQDLDKNNGTPSSMGASIRKEVMTLDNNMDKAFKMSNELLGDYDNISDIGKELRDMMIPFWSWQEVNIKRYYRLITNGLKGENASGLVKRLAIGQMTKIPYYAVAGAEAFAKIALFTIIIQAFNKFISGDDDDELPDDVKYRPHITLGKVDGKIYYFDRIGALSDAADWLNLDSAFIDVPEIINSQQTLGGYIQKMLKAPVSKVIGQLNPMLKMPIELATGRSLYPDAFNSRTIRDKTEYVAQTLGMTYPYKLATGKSHSGSDELTKLILYSLDPDEAAYFQTLDKVRQFQERVLDRKFEGFATTRRGEVLRNLKTALRYKDRAAVRRYLREYAKLGGTRKNLRVSLQAMNPLHGLSKVERKKFFTWLTADDKKYLRRANKYYRDLVRGFIR